LEVDIMAQKAKEIMPGGLHWKGALKDLKVASVELQHKAKEYWSERYASD
jgi:hypothetical protein